MAASCCEQRVAGGRMAASCCGTCAVEGCALSAPHLMCQHIHGNGEGERERRRPTSGHLSLQVLYSMDQYRTRAFTGLKCLHPDAHLL